MASVVNDSASLRGQQADGLARLNASERQVLLLLAEGHTAKSIATALGVTEAAVNERLREARRKTGVGSSRELARLLKAQEDRDELLGVASARRLNSSLTRSEPEPWRPHLGLFAMFGALLVAASAVFALEGSASQDAAVIDPLVGAPLERFPQPADLHERVRTQARDTHWATRVEQQIRARVSNIKLIGEGGNVLRVTCATTLCEIAGSVMLPAVKEEWLPQDSPYQVAIADLQGAPLADDLAKFGLKSESASFTGAKDDPRRSVFFLYYSRVEPRGS